MSTTTKDVLLSDDQLIDLTLRKGLMTREAVRKNKDLQTIYNARFLGGYEVRNLYEAERTKLLDLIRQGAEAVEIQAKSLRTYGPHPLIELQEQAFLSKVKEQLPNL